MSDPLCDAVVMQWEDAAEPIEWDVTELEQSIEEWEAIAARIVQLLHETTDCPASLNWRPHVAQIDAVVRRFRELCRRERQCMASCDNNFAASDAFERVWNEGYGLVKWLNRMMT